MNGWQIFVELTGRPPVEIRPGESLVGRSRTCQVHIPETTVSRQHARILSSALGEVTVEDLGSSNGTFVNGAKIEGRRKLADGDKILVGDAEMRIRIVAPVAASEATVRLTLPPLSQIAAAGAPPAMPPMPAAAPPLATSLPADDLDPWDKTPPAPLELPLEPLPAPRPTPVAPPPAPSAGVAETVFAPSPRPGAPPPMAPAPLAPPPPQVGETIVAPTPRPGMPPPMAPAPMAPPPIAPPRMAPPPQVGETIVAPTPRPGAPPPIAPPPLTPPAPYAAPPPAPPSVAATVAAPPRVMAAPPSPARTIDPPLQTAPPARPAAPPARKDALPSVTSIDRIPIPEPPAYVLEAARLERAKPAGFWIRVAATLIDAIPSIVVVTIGTVLAFVVHPMMSLLANLVVLPYAFYVGLYMPATQGTTFGKKMLGLRIVHPSVKAGDGLGWGVALLRVVGHMVCGFTLGIGYLLVAFTSQKQGLHDLIASTRVVRVR